MKDCIFCRIANKEAPADIVFEDKNFIAILDKYPQTKGHLQLMPKVHYTWVYDYPEMGKLFSTAGLIIRVIIPLLGADHVTIATYGHEVKHAHVWIVPQYKRDIKLHEGEHGRTLTGREELARTIRTALSKEVSV